jgi:hypothetical protein
MTTGTSKGAARRRRFEIIKLFPLLVLAGVSLLPSKSHAQATPNKWQGSFDALGRAGSENGGQVDLFAPLYQNNDTLLFGNAIGALDSDSSDGANFGGGIRHIVDGSYILGAYGYFDWLHSPNSNTFYQVSGGVEAMTADWDFRLNGYLPIAGSKDILNVPAVQGSDGMLGDPVVAIQDNEIGLLRQSVGGALGQNGLLIQEAPLGGVEGEIGYRLPFGNGLGNNTETRVFLGGYAFWGDGYPTYAGPRGRLELRVYDLPILGEGSRLTAGGELAWDDPRGVTGEGTLRLRIPLNIFGGGNHPQLSDLDRRMVDPVPIRVLPVYGQRQEVTIAAAGNVPLSTFEAVNDDETGREIESIYFASGNGASGNSGKQGDATDLTDAISRAGGNGLIVLTGSGGNVTGHFGLMEGQILLGGASSLQVTGVTSHVTLTYTPGLARPTIVSNGADINNLVSAISVSGHDHAKIQGVDITVNDKSGPGQIGNTGVYLTDSSSDIVRDVKVTGGDSGFVIDGETKATSGNLFNNISDTGSTFGMFIFSGDTTGTVSGLNVNGATFDSLAAPVGGIATGFASNTSGTGAINNSTLTNITVSDTSEGGDFLHMNGVTVTGWTGTGNDTSNAGGVAFSVQNGSGFQLSNFSVSGYRGGINLLNNGTGNSIDGSTQGIIKDLGALSTNGTSGIAIANTSMTISSISISGVGGTSLINPDFGTSIANPSTVKISNVAINGNNSSATQVTDAAILLSGNSNVITIQSGSDNNTAINVPQLCRNAESGTATVTGVINFTNPAAGTCP